MLSGVIPNTRGCAMRWPTWKHPGGGTFFFTLSTCDRQPLLTRPGALDTLRASLDEVRSTQPFILRAWVVLPDHLHFIWSLPGGDGDYASRWARLKAGFTRRLLANTPGAAEGGHSLPRVWQRRLRAWPIADPEEFSAHLDYLHYNPVKHGVAASAGAWRFSSFHTYVERGVYGIHWGGAAPVKAPASIR
jgi:putative transposase